MLEGVFKSVVVNIEIPVGGNNNQIQSNPVKRHLI